MENDPDLVLLDLDLPIPDRGAAWLAEVLRRQDGVATLSQLRRGGVTRRGWRRVAPSVVTLGPGRPTRRQRAVAAVLAAGGDAVVTGLTALELTGVPEVRYASEIHVLVPRSCGKRAPPGMVFERTGRMPVPLSLREPPTAPYARAVVDACRRLVRRGVRGEREGLAAMLSVVQRRLCGVAELRDECASAPVAVRRLVDEVASGVRSLPEAELRQVIRRSDLHEPLWNPRVYLLDGTFLCSPDGLWPDAGVVVEVDSVAYHAYGTDAEYTRERAERMRAAGLVVVSVRPRQIRDEPEEVLAQLRGARTRALAGPLQHLDLVVLPAPE